MGKLNKDEAEVLIGQLHEELTGKGIVFNAKKANESYENYVAYLESLLPGDDETDDNNPVEQPETPDSDAIATMVANGDTIRVKIRKGINVEHVTGSQRLIFKGGYSYALDASEAKSFLDNGFADIDNDDHDNDE